MADDNEDLLAQAKAIQAQKIAQLPSDNDLLSQARAIQAQKLEQSVPTSEPEQPSILSQGIDFAKNLPTSAIDLIPGMKEQRETVQANREATQNEPSDIPNMTQGQRNASFEQSAQTQMNDPAMAAIGATSESSLLDLAKMIPSIGSKLTALAPKLDVAGSKMAQEAMGMNSAKDLTSEFNPMTGKSTRGSDIIKGTGNTALDQGVLQGGQKNWYNNALDALESNYKKLPNLFQPAQAKIDQNLDQIISNVGPITTKTPDVMQDVFDSIPDTSQRTSIIRKLGQQYSKYEQKLGSAEGNLDQLNAIKQELTTAAENLSPQIYNNGSAKAESTLYKRLGGAVRQHIEDLANAADPGSGDQIHQVNKTIGDLSSMLPSLQKTTRGGLPTSLKDVSQTLVGPTEAFAAKTLKGASKIVQTPAGDLAQKAAPAVAKSFVDNPWKAIQSSTDTNNISPEQKTTKIAANLYNATDDSLKDVANTISKYPGMEHTADYLKKAIDNQDGNAKNRAIFLILQHPTSRALVTSGGSNVR